MKKAVVFDLDGTLINSLPDIAAAMNKALLAHGLPVHPQDAYKRFTGDGAVNLTRRAIGNSGQHLLEAVYSTYRLEYARSSHIHSAPYPGISEMLQTLQDEGMLLCVLSNKDDADTIKVVHHYFPGIRFAVVRGRREGVPLKPDPTALLEMVGKLQLTPDQCWYVGDTVTDMRCGRNAEMEQVAVLWGFQTYEEIGKEQSVRCVNNAEELTNLLRGVN